MIALSHGGTTTYSAPAPSNEMVVATADGVVKLKRAGANAWSVSHRALRGCHISSLIMPAPGVLFAGIFNGGVCVSEDGGVRWAHRDSGMRHKNVFSLLATQKDPGYRVYAGTQPAHLYFSDDCGVSWKELEGLRQMPSLPKWTFPAPPHEAHVKHIVADPTNSETIYACIEQGALLKSTDSGATWRQLSEFDDDVHFLSIDPGNARRMYMSSGVGCCYASADGGGEWHAVTTAPDHPVGSYPDVLVRRPGNPDVMFLGSARVGPAVWRKTHRSDSQLCRSDDAGQTWQVPDGFPSGLAESIQALALEDRGTSMGIYLGTTAGQVIASEDDGRTWNVIASELAPISKFGLDRALQGH